ncbi:hypothetical protein VTH06DRAFT_5206 [Thermothelomyces fergusii]
MGSVGREMSRERAIGRRSTSFGSPRQPPFPVPAVLRSDQGQSDRRRARNRQEARCRSVRLLFPGSGVASCAQLPG